MEKTGFCRFFNWRPFEIGIRRVQKVVEKVLRVLKVLKFDGPLARGLWYRHRSRAAARVQKVQKVQRVQRGRYCPAGDKYKASVTEFTFVTPAVHADGP